MSMPKSVRRRGAACPMILGVLGFLLGLAALVIAICRDPMMPGFSLRNPFGDVLSQYEVDTPVGSYTVARKAMANGDIKAMIEMDRRRDTRRNKEWVDSFKVADQKDFTREKDPKNKFDKGSGDCKILFIEYQRDGETVKEVAVMEKNNESGMWDRGNASPSDVEKKDKELAKKMREWPSGAKGMNFE